MKFINLLKKELRELITLQTVLSLVISMVIFGLLGGTIGTLTDSINEKMGSVAVADLDQSEASAQLLKDIQSAGFEVVALDPEGSEPPVDQAEDYAHSSCLVIPKGFGTALEEGRPASLEVSSKMAGFSIFSGMDQSASAAADAAVSILSSRLLQEGLTEGMDPVFAVQPLQITETTSANGQTAEISGQVIQSMGMQQGFFIPMVVFIMITFATQLNISAIANEKSDKTLETLLSAPVSRLSVLAAKMCASGLASLAMSAVYMIGLGSYMGGMMGSADLSGDAEAAQSVANAMQKLGLSMSAGQFFLLGVQLFLTILITLAVSMILGALAKDVKSSQGLIVPLMFAAMIPYMVTLFADISSLPAAVQVLLYLVPFTHTYTASANLLFGNIGVFYLGLAYQAVLLAATLFLAVRIFSSDRIFTMTLQFSGKKKKAAREE